MAHSKKKKEKEEVFHTAADLDLPCLHVATEIETEREGEREPRVLISKFTMSGSNSLPTFVRQPIGTAPINMHYFAIHVSLPFTCLLYPVRSAAITNALQSKSEVKLYCNK